MRATAVALFEEALRACSVEGAFRRKVVPHPDRPWIFELEGSDAVDLSSAERVLVIAVGKAAAAMTVCLLQHLPATLDAKTEGILIAPVEPETVPEGFRFFAGGHPLPNEASFAGARAIVQLLEGAASDPWAANTFCFFLLSGGASAMMELSLDPGITLADTIGLHHALVHSGASIAEINCVRKHFSAVKGGRLAQRLGAIRSLTIAVSDVPAGRLDALGSGPTLPDPTTVADCRTILQTYDLPSRTPPRVRAFFASAALPETPKPGSFPVQVCALLGSDDLVAAAFQHAVARGFDVFVDNTCDDWEAGDAAAYLLRRLRELSKQHLRVCLLSAGEVTVHVPHAESPQKEAAQTHGIGGRNLHFALHAALQMTPHDPFVVLSAGSDGVDGNSPAAGAVVDATTVQGCVAEAKNALKTFDSFRFLHARGCTLVTGPTGNNLRDLRVLLAERQDVARP